MATRILGAVGLIAWALLALTRRDVWSLGPAVVLAGAFGAALIARPLASRMTRALLAVPTSMFVGACVIAAGAISFFVVRDVLHDTPLSIDASVYLMEARALAHGALGAPIPAPMLSSSGRFLFEGVDGRMHGVFPPGYPLFVAPFVLIGTPLLAGPVTAALLVVAQYALGRAVGAASRVRDENAEIATRVSLLIALPSAARAIETADLLSHALVAVLATFALASALAYVTRPSRWSSAALGLCIGWTIAARLLDGLILAAVVVLVIVVARARASRDRAFSLRPLAIAVVAALPFIALLAADQRAATGSLAVPTQSEYFARADYPPTCHRLGFGADVGCNVEHPDAIAHDGPDGYRLDDAVRVTRERASVLGEDLFGFGPLALLAFFPLLARPRGGDVACAGFVLALTIGYALFYFGNAPAYGARHLFPAAPCFWLLVARALASPPHRASGWLDAPHVAGAAMLAAIATIAFAQRPIWIAREKRIADYHATRSDLRRIVARHRIDRGIVKSRDQSAVIAAFDPLVDGENRRVVLDDRSGLLELRRLHPDLPLFLALDRDEVGRLYTPPPPAPGLLVEIERAWPSFQRVDGLGARPQSFATASGESVLMIAWSREGATLTVPFDVGISGMYTLRVDGLAGPDHGDYALAIDGEPLPTWRGWSETLEKRRGEASDARALSAGRHTLVARCVGRAPESRGWLAAFDTLIGEPR